MATQRTSRVSVRSRSALVAAVIVLAPAGGASQCEPTFSLLPATPLAAGSYLESLHVEDVDGDGDRDAWLETWAGAHVAFNPGQGALLPASASGPFEYTYWAIDLAHVDGDGLVDLVVTDDYTPPLPTLLYESWVGVYLGHGDGQFEFSQALKVPWLPNETVVADLDGDGLQDLFTTYGDWSPGGFAATFGRADGTWEEPLIVSTGGAELDDAAVTDFDADGLLDAVAIKHGMWIVRQPMARQFDATQFGFANDYSHALAGDLDGDGMGDIGSQVGFGAPAILQTFLSQGAGAFGPPVTSQPGLVGSGYHYAEFALADVDLDGTLDLGGQLKAPVGTLAWARGIGDGSFEPAAPFSTAGLAKLLRYGDLDGDGDLDAVSADDVPEHLGSWINRLADWKHVGGGVAGAGLRPPTLHVSGAPCAGGTVRFDVQHAPPGAPGAVWLGFALSDGTQSVNGLLAAPRLMLATLRVDQAGAATAEIAWPVLAGAHGRRVLLQAQVQDAAAPGGTAASQVVADQID